jgi:DNA invertase Pin-like site-specific DNA recombinase
MQRYKAIEYTREKGLLITKEYIDEDVSAQVLKINKRPMLYQLINDIKFGLVQDLIVYKRDRLARNLTEHLEIYNLLREYKVKVHFTSNNEIPFYYNPVGEYIETIFGAVAENEVKQISKRIAESKITNFLSYVSTGGNLPYGYYVSSDNGKKTINIHTDKAFLVETVFNEFLKPECTSLEYLYAIMNNTPKYNYLDKNGQTGKKWPNYKLETILKTNMYHGLQEYKVNGQLYSRDQNTLAIIKKDVFYAAEEKLNIFLELSIDKDIRDPIIDFLHCGYCGNILEEYKGTKIFIRCRKCKVRVELEEVNVDLKNNLNNYFNSLLSEYFNELYDKSAIINKNRIQSHLTSLKKDTVQEITKLEKVVEVYLNEPSVTNRDQVSKIYDSVVELNSKIFDLTREQARFCNLKELYCEANNLYKSSTQKFFEDMVTKKEVLNEIIDSIQLFEYRLVFNFRHPFTAPVGVKKND